MNVVVEIARPDEEEWARVAQLTQRTNQFNFTTVRRSEPEVRNLSASGLSVSRVNVRDRFGDYGLVGIFIAKIESHSLVVDTLLLSCRILGRGVEHAIVRHLGEIALEGGLNFVCLPYVRTAKNEPARAFIENVASRYRSDDGESVIYRIPAAEARIIAHRPGHDPAAVMEALKSETKKPVASNAKSSAATANKNVSERYSNLARMSSGWDVLRMVRSGCTRARTLPTDPRKPATQIETQLLLLWEEALGLSGLGVEDDYFALGGTSLVAARLFSEIARRFGVKLPLTKILEAPTVRALAVHLKPQRYETDGGLVELRSGGPRNFFFVHDGDGETLLYLNLARRMPSEFTVYGIEPRRLTQVPLAHGCIEDMAAYYVERMRKRQPKGPYYLGGMCAGGVIAFEMASQLIQAGETVGLVGLLDAATPQAGKRPGRMTQQRITRLSQAVAEAKSRGGSQLTQAYTLAAAIALKAFTAARWEVLERSRRLWVRARFLLLRQLLSREKPWPSFVRPLSVRDIYDTAEATYAPAPLAGIPVVLARARSGSDGDTPYRDIYADDTFGWGKVSKQLTIIDVDGGHSSMLQEPFADCLAKALLQYLVDQPSKLQIQSQPQSRTPVLAGMIAHS